MYDYVTKFVISLSVWPFLYSILLWVFDMNMSDANLIVSTFHAIVVGIGGASLAIDMISMDTTRQYLSLTPGVQTYGVFFITYIFVDLLFELSLPRINKVNVLHHILFLTIGVLCGAYSYIGFCFTWLTIGELSTPFMNLHVYLGKILKSGRGRPWMLTLQKVNITIGSIVFFICRVFVYSLGLLHFFSEKSLVVSIPPPSQVLYLPICFIFMGYVLNFMWMFMVIKAVIRTFRVKYKHNV